MELEQERILVKEAQKGSHEAFLSLLQAHDNKVMSVVCRYSCNLFDREDLYQDIFLKCFQSIKSFKGNSTFSTWLYRLALNGCHDYMRKHRSMDPMEDHHQFVSTPSIESRHRLEDIHRACSQLSRSQRLCFHLFYVEGWTSSEIAETLQLREGTIKRHLDRARSRIRKDKKVLAWMKTGSNMNS